MHHVPMLKVHFNLWFNTGSEFQPPGFKPSLSQLCQLVFTSNTIQPTSGTGSVAKTMDWLPRDLKVKPKSFFRLNFSSAWALRKAPLGKSSPTLIFFSVWGRIQQSRIQLSPTHSKERQTPSGRGIIQVLCTHVSSRSGGKKEKNPCEKVHIK